MKSIIINLSTNEISRKADMFSHENMATTLTIDYRNCGVTGLEKVVDFEMADGTVTRISFGNGDYVSKDITNELTVEGDLKINPIARKDLGTGRAKQVGFKTFILKVQKTVNAYGEGTGEHNDIIIPILDRLTSLEDMEVVQNTRLDGINVKDIKQDTTLGLHDQRITYIESIGPEGGGGVQDPQVGINKQNISALNTLVADNKVATDTLVADNKVATDRAINDLTFSTTEADKDLSDRINHGQELIRLNYPRASTANGEIVNATISINTSKGSINTLDGRLNVVKAGIYEVSIGLTLSHRTAVVGDRIWVRILQENKVIVDNIFNPPAGTSYSSVHIPPTVVNLPVGPIKTEIALTGITTLGVNGGTADGVSHLTLKRVAK